MVETIADGAGSGNGSGELTSTGGDPDPFWSEEEFLAFEAELADIDRILHVAPKAGELLWQKVILHYEDEANDLPFDDKGPFKRLGSLTLSAN